MEKTFLLFPFGPSFWRGLAALGGLGLFLALEVYAPFRKPADSKLRRFWINVGITLLNVVILTLLFWDFFPKLFRFIGVHRFGLLNILGLSLRANVILSVILLDLLIYFWHVANHHFPFFWRFHRVHHTDPDLDVTSAFRFHLGEILFSTFLKIVFVLALGISFAGLIVFEITLLLAAQFQHSNIRLPGRIDWALRFVVVTPDMHRVHHSRTRRHNDSNFSTIFSIWDRLMGTYQMEPSQEKMKIGLSEYPRPASLTFIRLLFMPFEPNTRSRGSVRHPA